ncbi:hypothetical protein GGI11_000602 [Coemansia sp. RSA 2049]|nr:hypothetical protein GGI11_000602 [Coemansia sp. RSA 2049]
MCPAPLYSYFDAQQLADFIMNSEFPGYDGANTTPATSDSTFSHMHNIAAVLTGVPEDYESYDSARARKRRMTVSDGRRTDATSFGLTLPDASSGLFSMLDQQHGSSFANGAQPHSYSSSSPSGNMMQTAGLSSLSAHPGFGDSPIDSGSVANIGADSSNSCADSAQHAVSLFGCGNTAEGIASQNVLYSPASSNRAANGRKHQSLSISVGRDIRNE